MNSRIAKILIILTTLISHNLMAEEQIIQISDNTNDIQNQLLDALNSQVSTINKKDEKKASESIDTKKEDESLVSEKKDKDDDILQLPKIDENLSETIKSHKDSIEKLQSDLEENLQQLEEKPVIDLPKPEIQNDVIDDAKEEKKNDNIIDDKNDDKEKRVLEEKTNENLPAVLQDNVKVEENKIDKIVKTPKQEQSQVTNQINKDSKSELKPDLSKVTNKSDNKITQANNIFDKKDNKLFEKNIQETQKQTSFTDKIKNLFGGGDKEKKDADIFAEKIDDKKVATKTQLTSQKKKSVQNTKKSATKKTKETKLKNTLVGDDYEDKIFEYNKKPSNLNDYKIIAEMPSFIRSADDTVGNNHLNKIFSYQDYVRTLFKAVDDQDIGAMDRLLKILRNTEVKNYDGDTPLIYAVRNHKIKSIKFLLMRGSDRNQKNDRGENARNVAVANKDYEILSILHK